MEYALLTPVPIPWLLADVITLITTAVVVTFVAQRSKYPGVVLLECFGFVFLYASVFENFAVVQGWYVYGRSLMMIGDVPLSVPLIEMDVLVAGLWLVEKMDLPNWCKPFVVGLLGMLQDFSLDPLAVRQVNTVQGLTSGRWTWLLEPGMANIYNIPVYNFPGWVLIMMFATLWLLVGRYWFKRSGYNPAVGYAYPILCILAALLSLVSPLSQVLLWLGPVFTKGSYAEWVMLAVHFAVPLALLAFVWRGRMKAPLSLRDDLPVWAVAVVFHAHDILFTLAGGYSEVLWLVVLASAAHLALLGWAFNAGAPQKVKLPVGGFAYGPR